VVTNNGANPTVNSVVGFDRDVEAIRKYADVKIDSVDRQHDIENTLLAANATYKKIDTLRKWMYEPAREIVNRVNSVFNPYLEPLAVLIKQMEQSLKDWDKAETARIAAENTRIMEERAAQVTAAKETGEVVEFKEAPVEEKATLSRVGMGSVGYRKKLDITIVNAALVPRDLCEPSLSLIRKRAESGIRDIPGVLIEETKSTVKRTG
jgi:hypothetical protein